MPKVIDKELSLAHILSSCALSQGFELAGSVDIDCVDLNSEINHYDQWIQQGNAAQMDYLVRGRDRRANPRLLMPDAQSILCVAISYSRTPIGSSGTPRYARYLNGPDYHIDLAARLELAMTEVNHRLLKFNRDTVNYKIAVDTSAVLERFWAAQVGLGWIGKNTMLIHPQLGSYLFLASVLINQKVGQGPKPIPNYCGNCTKCLKSCPVEAFSAPNVLDSRRCLSYLTLEHRSDLSPESPMRSHSGGWIAGCDLCQEACPYNTKPSRIPDTPSTTPSATSLSQWQALLSETQTEYLDRVKNSALKRIKPAQFKRNLAIALTQQAPLLSDTDCKQLVSIVSSLCAQEGELKKEWELCMNALSSKRI